MSMVVFKYNHCPECREKTNKKQWECQYCDSNIINWKVTAISVVLVGLTLFYAYYQITHALPAIYEKNSN